MGKRRQESPNVAAGQSAEKAPKVKKNSKVPAITFHEDVETENDHDKNDGLVNWSVEEIQLLVEQAEQWTKDRKPDTKSWITSLTSGFDWSIIDIPGKTLEECKSALKQVLKKVRNYRTFTEMITDAVPLVKKPSFARFIHPDMPAMPIGPFFIYLNENREKLRKKHPEFNTIQISKKASEMYKNLSDKEKQKITDRAEQKREEYRVQVEALIKKDPSLGTRYIKSGSGMPRVKAPAAIKPPSKPRSALALYVASHLQEGESSKAATDRLKPEFEQLSDKKRLKWAKKAVKDATRYQTECQEFQAEYPEVELDLDVKPALTQKDRDLIDESNGLPPKPPANSYTLFMHKFTESNPSILGKDRIKAAAEAWKSLSETDRKNYNIQWEEMDREYIYKIKAHLDTLSPDEKYTFLTTQNLPALNKYDNKPALKIESSSSSTSTPSTKKKTNAATPSKQKAIESRKKDSSDSDSDLSPSPPAKKKVPAASPLKPKDQKALKVLKDESSDSDSSD